MNFDSARTKTILVAVLLLLTVVPTLLVQTGDAVECEPICDSCHDSHDRVYHAYLDITRFRIMPTNLNGTDVGLVEVQLYLHGNVGLGYTSVRRGHLTLSANNDRVGVQKPRQEFISFQPGFSSFYWNITGRLNGTDTMHVEVYALGVHLDVEFFLSADSGQVVVTNPVNAAPRVTITQPDGYDDTATRDFQLELDIDDPNNDPMLADFWYDDDRDRSNGATIIARSVPFPETYVWDTRGLPNGWYYIHVDVDDQMGGFDSTTSEHPVIVSHNNAVPNVELVTPVDDWVVRDPVMTFTWRSQDADGDRLTYEVWVGRERDYMELVGNTTRTTFQYAAADNARLIWNVIPNDGTVRGWSRNGPLGFTTDIAYPVEVDLILPSDGAVVPGPDVKLVWYGRDMDYEQVLYSVWLEHDGDRVRLVKDWDDPAGPVLVVPDLTPGETYTWWVEGDNPYSPKGVSQVWNFTVASKGTPGALLDEEVMGSDGVTLHWSPDPGGPVPDSYDVHLVDHLGGQRLLAEGTSETSMTIHDLIEDATYHWYVVPFDVEGERGFSTPSFRTFAYDTNSPPVASIGSPYLVVEPGTHVLEWSGHDPDGDDITYDVYIDPVNGTTLAQANTTATRFSLALDADRMYFWRVVPRDAYSVGEAVHGVVLTGPGGTSTPATGALLSPPEGATVPPPMVNLTWNATDPLERTLLYTVYLDTEGGDPLESAPLVVNATTPWFVIELEEGSRVTWAVEARPIEGPASLLGTATFEVGSAASESPVAILWVDGNPPGNHVVVRALTRVALDGNSSTAPTPGDLEYLFDFGDGTASGWVSEASVEHSYLVEGTFNASLTVRLVDGPGSEPARVVVTVLPGDKTSEDEVPGASALLGAIALMVACALSFALGRDVRGGGGRR